MHGNKNFKLGLCTGLKKHTISTYNQPRLININGTATGFDTLVRIGNKIKQKWGIPLFIFRSQYIDKIIDIYLIKIEISYDNEKIILEYRAKCMFKNGCPYLDILVSPSDSFGWTLESEEGNGATQYRITKTDFLASWITVNFEIVGFFDKIEDGELLIEYYSQTEKII